MTRCINPVKNNIDKQNTYRNNIARYNRAMREGFYLEALLIDYAVIEDRLRSFLYHIGLLKTKDSFKIDGGKAKESLKPIITEYKRKDENANFIYNSISGKMKIIRCTLMWAEQEDYNQEDKYLVALRRQYEVIHALLNKNMDSLYERLEAQAGKGMDLARFLDSQVKCVKKNNRIRRCINLPDR